MSRFLFAGCFQIRKKDIPKIMYSTVQTGPNIQFGGLNEGLLSEANQSGTASAVNKPAI